jgi:hypothetical protein
MLKTSFLLRKQRSVYFAARGGGFHKPDPPLPESYIHRKRLDLEMVNREIYHDVNPEFHLHIHNPDLKGGP